jgi:hypothetical protein
MGKTSATKPVVVVPSIREDCFRSFLDAWENELGGCTIVLVEDNPEPTFDVSRENVFHFAWTDIDSELGDLSWIIPRRTDCIRSFGFWKAIRLDPEFIITLDDDCYPHTPAFVELHRRRLFDLQRDEAWVSTGRHSEPRGVPYYERFREATCVLNTGLWTNVPDFDAPTQLMTSRVDRIFEPIEQTVPKGRFFPMCGMNVAFRAEVTPAFYFLLMGQGYEFDRFGDIWAGVLVKKICDHLGYLVCTGKPLVEHQRASNVWANLVKEAPGLSVNETLWQAIDRIVLSRDDFPGCYAEIAEKLEFRGDYWDRVRQAMKIWSDLF